MALIDFVKRFEGIKDGDGLKPGLQPYRDPRGYWTIGYGELLTLDRAAPMPDLTITYKDADARLAKKLAEVREQVLKATTAHLAANELDALTDFTYNEGITHYKGSILRECVNAGHRAAAANEFGRWIYSDGKVLPGLIVRRAAERQLYLGEITC